MNTSAAASPAMSPASPHPPTDGTEADHSNQRNPQSTDPLTRLYNHAEVVTDANRRFSELKQVSLDQRISQHIELMQQRLMPEQQQRVLDCLNQLLVPATASTPGHAELLTIIPDIQEQIKCLQQAEAMARAQADQDRQQGTPLSARNIVLLTETLKVLGDDVDPLAYQLLNHFYIDNYQQMFTGKHREPAKSLLLKTFLQLTTAQDFLHHPQDKGRALSVQTLARLVEEQGYEVVADQLQQQFGCYAGPEPVRPIHPMGMLSYSQLQQAMLTLYRSTPSKAPTLERWGSIADAFNIPLYTLPQLTQGLHRFEEAASLCIAQKVSQSTVSGFSWLTLSQIAKKANLYLPPESERTKIYPPYSSRPDEQLLQKELIVLATRWQVLACRLDFTPHSIELLALANKDCCLALDALLSTYMRRRTASWEQIADALDTLEHNVLAMHIRRKYLPAGQNSQQH